MCRIRDIDLIAKEAHYHNHCRRSYTRSDVRRPINPNSETSAVLSAHKKAYICIYVYNFEKNDPFPLCPHISIRPLKIGAFRQYEVYLFEMSKTCAILCKAFENFSLR